MNAELTRLDRIDPALTLPLRDHVHRRLRLAILSGGFARGTRLSERTLAEELGVSTTPLKEALRQLESEGLVLALPRRGIIVQYDARRAEEMILARAALESMIARMAAQRIEEAAAEALTGTLMAMAVATREADVETLVRQNSAFHEQIHIASGCEHLCRLLEQQSLYDEGTRRVIHDDAAEREHALAEHSAIGEAIIGRNIETAETAMRAHVLRSGAAYLRRVFGKQDS